MPKLKPIKDEDELAAIPLNEPVLVELEPPATGAAPEVEDRSGPDTEVDKTDGVEALKTQLKASEDATRRERERATTAEREAQQAREETARLKTANGDTEKELLTNSLASAQSDVAAAKAEFKVAFESADPDAIANAQEKIGRAAAKVIHFEGAIASAEDDAKTEADRPEQQQPQVDIITAIDRMPNLVPKERDWLKAHPEVLTDPVSVRELDVAYNRAIKQGFKRGTDGYFKFLDTFMGYAEPEKTEQPNEDNDPPSQERASIVSAPVARDNRSSLTNRQTTPTRIMLTPEQRDLARSMGLTDVQYAKGKLQLDANKKADPERFAGR